MQPESPRKDIVTESARLQRHLSSKIDRSLSRTSIVQSLYQSPSKMIHRRISDKRSPLTGVASFLKLLEEKNAAYLQNITGQLLKQNQRLSPYVLETWLNTTLADAEDLGINGCILKPESRLPLERYGVDRSSLLTAGLSSSEIDRIYRCLFVYSIGFYQMVLRILEHTDQKYTIVAGIWKLFAILLEQCCHIDYQMIIAAIHSEKNDEVENISAFYKEQIAELEQKEKEMLQVVKETREELIKIQRSLRKETDKRKELEEELLQKGTGHEDEITMRLSFESKINNMSAKFREMNAKMTQLAETINEQAVSLQDKTIELSLTSQKVVKLKNKKEDLTKEIRIQEGKVRDATLAFNRCENRLVEVYGKLETSAKDLSELQVKYHEIANDSAQKDITIDDLRCEIELFKKQAENAESAKRELQKEKSVVDARLAEIESLLFSERERYKSLEIELVNNKDENNRKTTLLDNLQEVVKELKSEVKSLSNSNSSMKIHLDTSVEMSDNLRKQLKITQERMEEMNKARRVVDEKNDNLFRKLNNVEEELRTVNSVHRTLKEEFSTLKEKYSRTLNEKNELKTMINSNDSSFETQKFSLMEQIKNLNNTIENEKKVRHNWISKYEDEQKMHVRTVKTLTHTQNSLNDTHFKVNNLTSSIEEYKSQAERLSERSQEQFKELLELRYREDEYLRKIKTFQMLLETIDLEHKEKINEFEKEIERIHEEKEVLYNLSQIENNEIWEIARINYENSVSNQRDYKRLTNEFKRFNKKHEETKLKLNKSIAKIERKSMATEELLSCVHKLEQEIEYYSGYYDKYLMVSEELTELKSWLPEDIREKPQPIKILLERMNILEKSLNDIELKKNSLVSVSTSTDMSTQETETQTVSVKVTSRELQTDLTVADLEKMLRGAPSEFPIRQKISKEDLSIPDHDLDLSEEPVLKEDLPLKSVYEITPHVSDRSLLDQTVDRLPEIARKPPKRQVSQSPYQSGPLPSLKRTLKQAISRRKYDDNVF